MLINHAVANMHALKLPSDLRLDSIQRDVNSTLLRLKDQRPMWPWLWMQVYRSVWAPLQVATFRLEQNFSPDLAAADVRLGPLAAHHNRSSPAPRSIAWQCRKGVVLGERRGFRTQR